MSINDGFIHFPVNLLLPLWLVASAFFTGMGALSEPLIKTFRGKWEGWESAIASMLVGFTFVIISVVMFFVFIGIKS